MKNDIKLRRKQQGMKEQKNIYSLSTVAMFKNVSSAECIELTDEQLKQLQMTLLEILIDIDLFCRKNGICYYLGGGSALGAVRHNGFIPWDDDIDINMPRRDYKRFIELFPKALGKKYWLHTPENTKNYELLLARVRMKGTNVKTREDFFNDECGAFVDVFVVENVPDNKVLRTVHGFGSLTLGFLLSCRKFYRERNPLKKMLEAGAGNESLNFAYHVKTGIGFLTAIFPIDAWVHLNHWWNGLCKNDNSTFVTVPSGRKHYCGEQIERAEIFPVVSRPFEGKMMFTARTDKYLRQLYGDYWEIPSTEEREKHILFKPFQLDRTDK